MTEVLIIVFVVLGLFLGVNEEWLYPGHPRFAIACLLAAMLVVVAVSLLICLDGFNLHVVVSAVAALVRC